MEINMWVEGWEGCRVQVGGSQCRWEGRSAGGWVAVQVGGSQCRWEGRSAGGRVAGSRWEG